MKFDTKTAIIIRQDLSAEAKVGRPRARRGLPQAGLTSWQALFDHGHLGTGQTVLILGAGGALGIVAVQLAHGQGVQVVGAGRNRVKAAVLEAGADRFVDVEQRGWERSVGQVDVVYDLVGGEVLEQSLAALKPGGRLVTVVAPPEEARQDIKVVNFIRDPNGQQLRKLAELIDAGRLHPQVGAVYPLSQTRAAFEAKTAHGVTGKVILTP